MRCSANINLPGPLKRDLCLGMLGGMSDTVIDAMDGKPFAPTAKFSGSFRHIFMSWFKEAFPEAYDDLYSIAQDPFSDFFELNFEFDK